MMHECLDNGLLQLPARNWFFIEDYYYKFIGYQPKVKERYRYQLHKDGKKHTALDDAETVLNIVKEMATWGKQNLRVTKKESITS